MSEQQAAIKCAIVVGIRQDGSVFLETHGTERNLITIEGLLGYGQRYVVDEWAARKNTSTTEEPEVEVIAPVAETKVKRTRKKAAVIDA